MALTLICPDRDPAPWITALNALDPDLDIRIWPDDGPVEDIELALTWAHPPGILRRYPALRCISSMGAGVDHLLSDPDLPRGVSIVRIVDPDLVRDMAEYLLVCVLFYFRQFHRYENFQSLKTWQPLGAGDKQRFSVGILGMGQLGRAAGRMLKNFGFPVAGWKNSPASIPGFEVFSGEDGLAPFLNRTRVLICLLPLTEATREILDLSLFSRLNFSRLNKDAKESGGAFLINAARGGHLKEGDLIRALDRNWISGAWLDVFESEPLPQNHPFWTHPGIRITPHVSSLTRPRSVAPQVLENLHRIRTGEALLNPVDPHKGY